MLADCLDVRQSLTSLQSAAEYIQPKGLVYVCFDIFGPMSLVHRTITSSPSLSMRFCLHLPALVSSRAWKSTDSCDNVPKTCQHLFYSRSPPNRRPFASGAEKCLALSSSSPSVSHPTLEQPHQLPRSSVKDSRKCQPWILHPMIQSHPLTLVDWNLGRY